MIARDITESKQYQRQLEQHANYDPLTKLPNRNLLSDRTQQAFAYADRFGTSAIVAFIDLDNFKLVNDMLGHPIGDQLLVSIANRLKSCVREGDTVARYGGDEFVLLLTDSNADEVLGSWMRRLSEKISQPVSIAEHQLFVTCSIGLSVYPRDGNDIQTLLKHADTAMYQAKSAGRNQFKFFTPGMNEKIKERFTTEAKLRRAIERREFLLHYQPQVDLQTGKVVGTEALIRWNSPDDGMISPAKFIPIAEESGLIGIIGNWVLTQACRDNKALLDTGAEPITISVNLSAKQFFPITLVKSVKAALRKSGLAPELLKLEVTETMVMRSPEEAEQILKGLKRLGVKLAIDDFGIGYSSLSYLQRFPMDQLKIDQSFIRHVADDTNDAAITQAIIQLGHSLKLEVIAEGVANQRQVEFLRNHACDSAQGYYFCKPVPFEGLQHVIRSQPRNRNPLAS